MFGRGVEVFRAGAVEVFVVDTHPPATVRLGNHDDVRQSSRVLGFAYEFGR